MIEIDKVFTGRPVPLPAMLARREERVSEQREALKTGCPCIVSFCLNIPGPVKNFPLAEKAFATGCEALCSRLGTDISLFRKTNAETGCEAVFLCARGARETKAVTVAIEEEHLLGRLFDMDVLGQDGHISREELGCPPRKCLLCGREASVCGRSRAHAVSELQAHIASLLEDFFAGISARKTTEAAYEAMLGEVSVTPKPGLVDLHDNGAHTDMDPATFYKSAEALRPWIEKLYLLGRECHDASAEELFLKLRETGREAEADMFRATGGVNTHKGLLFSFAILAGAAGRLQVGTDRELSLEDWTAAAAELGRCSLSDLEKQDADLAACYHAHGVTGARGEAANGFPTVISIGLPVYTAALKAGGSGNYAGARTLLALIAGTEDSNMIRRGGKELAGRHRKQAADLLPLLNEDNYREILSGLNDTYVRENISPGGCADLLALTVFLHRFSA